MIPRPLVPASLIPFLDPWGWWVAALAVGLAGVGLVLCRQGPGWRGLFGRTAVVLAGIGLLLELQRRGGIGAPVRSWPGLLLWVAAGAAATWAAASVVDRVIRSRKSLRQARREEPEP